MNNRSLPIITTTMDPRIDNMIAMSSRTPHTLATPTTKEIITKAARSSEQILRTPRHISQTGKDGDTAGNTPPAVWSPRDNTPVLSGDITVCPASGHSGSSKDFNKRQSTIYNEIGVNQKLDTSIDINLLNDGDSASIFSKAIGCALYHSSSTDLYLCLWMDFASNVV